MVDGGFSGVGSGIVSSIADDFKLRWEDWSEGGKEGIGQGGGGSGVDEEDLRWTGSWWRGDRGGERRF